MNKKNLSVEQTFALAFQNHQKNNFQEAENLYNEILKINPDHFKSIFYLGSLLAQTRNFAKAKQLFQKAIQIQPDHTNAHNNLGLIFHELGEFQKAKSSYQKAIQIQPNLDAAHNNLGLVFEKLKEHQKAMNSYQKAIEINPNYSAAYYNHGNVLKKLAKFQEAKNSYQKTIQIQPNHAAAHNNLGLIFLELGEFQKAKNSCQKAIEIQPNYLDAYNNLGISLQELGEYQKAIISCQKAIEIQPNYAASYNNLGNLFKELGNFEKAKQLLQKAIEIQPNYAAAHNNLGNLFKELREHQKAKNCFQKAVEIDPNFSMAYYNLGKIFRKLGKQKEAIKYFKKTDSTRSRAELLECTYFSEGLKTYPKILEKLAKKDPLNLRIASMAAYVSKKENIKNIYSFCKNPLDFVFTKNLKNELISSDKFSKNLSEILSKTELIWEPSSKTTSSGYHTLGNLFEKKDAEILILRQLIEKQVIIYKETYKTYKDYFITKWPLETKIVGWHVKLIKKGFQESHIHPAGWLSGCFYLKIPKMLNKNEGAIEFTLSGYDYPYDKNLPSFIHAPKVFDIALFPSSLFHKTIPFNSQEERHVIAFDLMPK